MLKRFKVELPQLGLVGLGVATLVRSPRARRAIYRALPLQMRQGFLESCLISENYQLILDGARNRLNSPDCYEACCVARALAESGMAETAFAALQGREAELLADRRCISHFLVVAQHGATTRKFFRIAKQAVRQYPSHYDLLGFIATGMRQLRQFAALQRFTANVIRRFERGQIPIAAFIQIMRAIDRRAPLSAARELAKSSNDPVVHQQFIESMVELLMLEEGARLTKEWGVSLKSLSKSHQRALNYYEARKQRLGVKSLAGLEEAVIRQISQYAETRAKTNAFATRPRLRLVGSPNDRPTSVSAPRPDRRCVRILIMASSLGIGGAERQLSYLVNHLAQLPDKFEVLLFLGEAKEHEFGIVRSDRIRVVYRADLPSEIGNIAVPTVPRSLLKDIEIVLQRKRFRPLLRMAEQFQPDIVYHAIGLPTEPLLIGALLGTPKVIIRFGGLSFFNDFSASDGQEINYGIANRCCQLLADKVTFLVNSEAGRNAWSARFGIAPDRVKVIRNGSNFTPLEVPMGHGRREALFGTTDVKVIGFVGRFHDIKRPVLWLQAAIRIAARDPDTRFLMVGEGMLRRNIMERIAKGPYQDRFVMAGHVGEGLDELYRAMDVLLVTSDTESFPNVVIEALGQGCYVVAPPVGDIASILNDPRLGRVVSNDTIAGFVSALSEVLVDLPSLSESRSFRAENIRKRFDVEMMVDQYVQEFEIRPSGYRHLQGTVGTQALA